MLIRVVQCTGETDQFFYFYNQSLYYTLNDAARRILMLIRVLQVTGETDQFFYSHSKSTYYTLIF